MELLGVFASAQGSESRMLWPWAPDFRVSSTGGTMSGPAESSEDIAATEGPPAK